MKRNLIIFILCLTCGLCLLGFTGCDFSFYNIGENSHDDKEPSTSEGTSHHPDSLQSDFEFELVGDGYSLTGYNGSDETVTIPSSYKGIAVTSIDAAVFRKNKTIVNVIIPKSIIKIGGYSFLDCPNFTTVFYMGSETEWNNIKISETSGVIYALRYFYSETIPTKHMQYWHYVGGKIKSDTKHIFNTNGICVVCGAVAPQATSSEYFEFTYLSETDSYSIKAKNKSNLPIEIILPSTYNGKPITSIGKYAFDSCSSLTDITIPDSVTSIGYHAFDSCSSLTDITIPDSVTSIGWDAFCNCGSLTSITIPDSVTSIGNYAFSGCSSLTSINIPDSVTSIGNSAFESCSSLTSVTIPDSVTSIGKEAFENCRKLTKVYYTGTIDEWCYIRFASEYSNPLRYANNLYINNELVTTANIITATKINAYAFYNFDSLTSVTIDNRVTSIGEYAFSDCSSLTSVTIGNSVISIGDYVFKYCSKLTSITIPDSVTSIKHTAFAGCPCIKTIEGLGYVDKWLVEADKTIISATIKDGTIGVADSAFHNFDSLTSITIPDSVTSLGQQAFYNCSSLTSITFGENSKLESIGDYVFSRCSSLTSITISDSVTSIGSGAFYDCSSLTSITIPDSVTSIGENAFGGCSSLTSVTIGNSVTSIGGGSLGDGSSFGGAFANCSSLTSITIPDSVTSIGENAFGGCSSLTSIIIPDRETCSWGITKTNQKTINKSEIIASSF